VAVPPRFELDPGPGPDPDWSAVLAEAGFDPAGLQPSASHWSAPVDSDRKGAWDGALPDQPDVRFHIEAAAYRGRLVYFEAQGPWMQPPRAAGDSASPVVGTALIFFLSGMVLPAVAVLVRRNLRLGRGDRKGALRLAVFTFVSFFLADLFRADHTALPIVEFNLLTQIASQGFAGALGVWLIYMALEPAVRRRWPHTLISWNRLLAGRFRDPLLGRDVLVGALAGVAVMLDLRLDLASLLLGRAPGIFLGQGLTTLTAPRHLAYYFLLSPCQGVLYSVAMLFELYLFQALARRAWVARLLLFFSFLAAVLVGASYPLGASVPGVILSAIVVAVLVRFGLLTSATLWFTFLVLATAPLTLDGSTWYAGRSYVVLLFFAALLGAAFYTALGGKPLFGRALLED
jgi:serine/threonine-protein kinase